MEAYPGLRKTLGCYLNQDWTLEFATEDDALAAILRECNTGEVSTAISELDLLLASPSDATLSQALEGAGCYFYPPGAGTTYREWLSQVRDAMAAKVRS